MKNKLFLYHVIIMLITGSSGKPMALNSFPFIFNLFIVLFYKISLRNSSVIPTFVSISDILCFRLFSFTSLK